MSDCKTLDAFVTPYVDQELDAPRRAALDAHVRVCPPCHSRVAAEREVRELLRARKPALQTCSAPSALRATCAGLAGAQRAPGARLAVRPASRQETVDVRGAGRAAPARLRRYALAATVVLAAGGALVAVVYEATDRSVRVMAAELTADHVKCFGVNRLLGTHDAPAAVERTLASRFSWAPHLPDRPERAGLELVGARPCLYGEGRVAHIMYRHNGTPVSVFMLPRSWRPDALVDVLGHEASVWSVGDRTFVLVAKESRAEVERLATFVHAGLR